MNKKRQAGLARRFSICSIQPQKSSDSSGPAIESNDHFSLFNNHRNFPAAIGIFQHLIQLVFIIQDVMIFNIVSFLDIGFTSRSGKRSCVFSVN